MAITGFITVPVMIDWLSMISVVGIASIFIYIILVYFRGMEKPPFWIYFIFGFIIVSFQSILTNIERVAQQTIYPSIVRLIGTLIMLYGASQLLKSYQSKIKFDKKLKKK